MLLGLFQHFLCLARQFSQPICLSSCRIAFIGAWAPYVRAVPSVTYCCQAKPACKKDADQTSSSLGAAFRWDGEQDWFPGVIQSWNPANTTYTVSCLCLMPAQHRGLAHKVNLPVAMTPLLAFYYAESAGGCHDS